MPARLSAMNWPPQILYHYPCPDGVFAALAAHLSFSVTAQKVIWVPNAVFAPRQVNDLQLQAGQTLYMLDFAGPPGFAKAVAEHGARVVVLDHHKTALELLNTTESQHPNLDAQIDMSRSGATIALDYFKPEVLICSIMSGFTVLADICCAGKPGATNNL
ncbi:hypothetical protein ABBQ32_011953 [Trebouxia sp. C0010 RCD-2024]